MTEPRGREANRGTQSRLMKNITSNWVGLVVKILLSFFLAPFVVKGLGSVYYGIWTLLNEFTGYLWLFDFGVRESVIKYVAQYHAKGEHEELERTVNAALFMYTVIALIAFVGTLGLAFALPYLFTIPAGSVDEARWTLLFTGSAIAEGFIFNVFVGVLMGLQRFYIVTRLGVIFSFVRAGLIVLALSNGYGIVALGAIQLALSTAGGLLSYRVARQSLPYYRPRLTFPGRDDVQRVFTYSKYVLGNNLAEKVVFRTDAFVIGVFLPVATLTYYAIAGSLVGYVRSIVMTMAVVLNPVSSALEATEDRTRLRALFFSACKGAVVIGAPVCVGLIVLGRRFIGLWMGPAVAPQAGEILVVLSAAYLIGLPHYCISSVLYGLGRHRIMARWRAVEAAANIVLSVILVQQVGLIGVALGTLISHVAVAGGALPYAITRDLKIPLPDYYRSTYGRPLLASLPFAAVCYYIDRDVQPGSLVVFFAVMAAALGTYAVPCWFISLSPTERGTLRARIAGRFPRLGAAPKPARIAGSEGSAAS